MSTGLTVWIVFFALWLFALHRATHRAFTLESARMPGIPFAQGALSGPTIIFHLGLTTVLLVTIIASAYEDAQMLWFAMPGLLAALIQGVLLTTTQDGQPVGKTRRLSPYWISEQWPFALLGLGIGASGSVWWLLTGSNYPLLLVGYSALFLAFFWLYFTRQNAISVSPTTFQYVRSFPRLRTFTHKRPRTSNLAMRMKRRRRGVYDLRIDEAGQPSIEMTATLTSRQRLSLELEEYFVRTDQL